jgi:cytoplasmic iron level regulating protein YaaA (DUF328/UPF0246 family)
MKILLAPSETKNSGGKDKFGIDKLSFDELNNTREQLIDKYNHIVLSKDLSKIKKLFGLKKDKDIEVYLHNLYNTPTLKAISRYTGVAFDYLGYNELDYDAQNYIDNNVIIFSNLFGVLQAKDLIPNYRLKQGEHLDNIKIDTLYKPIITKILDKYLEDEDILDIRAIHYNKFYKPSKSYTTLKFLKDGKVVSHWAKAYRGMVLKEVAKNQITTIDDFMKLNIDGLSIKEVQQSKNKTEIVYDIH